MKKLSSLLLSIFLISFQSVYGMYDYQAIKKDLMDTLDTGDIMRSFELANRISTLEKILHKSKELSFSPCLSKQIAGQSVAKVLPKDFKGLNFISENGYTPLGYAVIKKNMGAICFFISNGACLEGKDSYGTSPFDYARAIGDARIIEALESIKKEQERNYLINETNKIDRE